MLNMPHWVLAWDPRTKEVLCFNGSWAKISHELDRGVEEAFEQLWKKNPEGALDYVLFTNPGEEFPTAMAGRRNICFNRYTAEENGVLVKMSSGGIGERRSHGPDSRNTVSPSR